MNRGKQVQFNDVVYVGIATHWLSEERENIWYQDTEIDTFKRQARCLSFQLDTNIVIDPLTKPGDDNIECTRGLELFRSIQRLQNRIISRRIILKAQKRFQDPSHVALVADKCTEWSKQIALITAKNDHHHVTNKSFRSNHELPCCKLLAAYTILGKRDVVPNLTSQRIKRRKFS